MENRKELAATALRSIREALESAKRSGAPADVVFLSSELRYILAAHPGDAFCSNLELGDTVYEVPVIRFIGEDKEKFFLARACPVDPAKGYKELIPRRIYGRPGM